MSETLTDRKRNRWHAFLPVALLFVLALFLRLVSLDLLPAFCDELLHIGWAKKAADCQTLAARVVTIFDDTWQHGRFIHVFLLSWLPGTALDMISGSRVVSAVFGSSAVLALFLAGRRLRDDTAGYIAAGLYSIIPFSVMHDRLVLADPILCALTAWIVLISLDLSLAPRWRWWQTLLLAALLFMAVGTKVTGALVFAYPCIAVLFAARSKRRWLYCGLAVAVAGAAISPALVHFLRSNAFEGIRGQSQVHVWRNLATCISWIWLYWTPPVVLLAAVGAIEALLRGRRKMIAVATWGALPIIAFSLISSDPLFFPRYLLLGIHAGLLLVAVSASCFLDQARRWSDGRRFSWKRPVIAAAAFACIWPSLSFDYRLITSPESVELPAVDKSQYVSGLPSGYGSRDCAAYFHTSTQMCAGSASLIVPNGFVRRAVSFYLPKELTARPSISPSFASPEDRQGQLRERELAEKGCLFLILADGALPQRQRPTPAQRELVIEAGILLAEFPKPADRIRIRLYRVGPDYLPETEGLIDP